MRVAVYGGTTIHECIREEKETPTVPSGFVILISTQEEVL